MTIGEIIRNYRQKKGWSMQNLADNINITSGYISDIENNKRKTPPTNETLLKISNALGLSEQERFELLKLAAIERTPEIIINELLTLKKEVDELKREKKINTGSFNNISAGNNINISHINIRNGLAQSYNENDIVEKINELPVDMQKEVFEFINFKHMIYKKNNN